MASTHHIFTAVSLKIRVRWVGHVAYIGKRKGAHRILVEKHEGKKTHGRPRHRW